MTQNRAEAPAKAGKRVEGSSRLAGTIWTPSEDNARDDSVEVSRVMPLTVHPRSEAKRRATDPPWVC